MTGGTRWRLQRHPAPNHDLDGDDAMATQMKTLIHSRPQGTPLSAVKRS